MSPSLFYVLIVLAAVAYPASSISSDALYKGLKQRFLKKNPNEAKLLNKFESTVRGVYDTVVADNSGCPILRNGKKTTKENLESSYMKELLKVKPSAALFQKQIEKLLWGLLDDVIVRKQCYDLAPGFKLSSAIGTGVFVSDVTQAIKTIPRNVKLSHEERELSDVLLLGSLNDLMNSEDETGDDLKRDYQRITSALITAFPDEKNKIKKLSSLDLTLVPLQKN